MRLPLRTSRRSSSARRITGRPAVPSLLRRQALTNWAMHTDGWITEDDVDAEFRYDRDPVGMVRDRFLSG